MTYTEIKQKGERKYYYRVKSIRKGQKVDKQRIYLGANLNSEEINKKEQEADRKLLNTQEQIPEPKPEAEKKQLGITAEKDEFSDWFTQIIQKAELIEYTNVSGSYILRPNSYFIWEQVQKYFDEKIKKDGVKNAYFPLLIPKSNLSKEQEHVKGFTPEVAWVTHSGETELQEPLAVRPTSETVMYPAYSKWIRSHRDLPLRLNQWCNIVRWEFQNPVPFLRSREFLWQEGHSVFAEKQEADKEVKKTQDFYSDTYKDVFAIPVIKGRKTEKEKFAGGDYTLTVEAFLPSGKAIQGATSHMLGQNFAKAFDITFLDKNEKKQYPFQNSWGITTRSIGVAIMMHSDDKGLVLSPKVAPIQIIIIPIFNKASEKSQIIKQAEKIKNQLGELDLRVEIDIREDVRPGNKYNEWEMKGVPLRIEIGPRDIKNRQVVIATRHDLKKQEIKITDLEKKIPEILDTIHDSLYKKAQKYIKDNTIKAEGMQELGEAIKDKQLVKTQWCENPECEDLIKHKTGGAKIICILESEKPTSKCVYCSKKSKHVVYVAKSY